MWEIIRANQRKSAILVTLMGILLIAIGGITGYFMSGISGAVWGVIIATAVWLIQLLISFSAGMDIMLSASGAKPVTPDVHPQLYNVVEEMRIAAGMNVTPKVYIINSEMPNAFATGMKPEKSAIAVTAGLLGRLNRDELQGVVAHEMSHIVNRDIRFMTIAGVMMGTIVLIAEVVLRGLFWTGGGSRRSDNSGGGAGQIIMLVVVIVVAILAPLFAQLLYFSISRKREYLADASAVRLTRYPEGLASALEKISNSSEQITTANRVTAPLYIVNPLKRTSTKKVSDLTSTHPPISERIRILRAMAGGASYANYDQAYRDVRKSSGVIPKSGLMEGSDAPLRQATAGDVPVEDVKTTTRATGDVMMAVNNYRMIDCSCGLKLKVPPTYKGKAVYCPRCGASHAL
jgi:heat shock protein HtpX